MANRDRVLTSAVVVSALCTVFVTGIVVRREFFAADQEAATPPQAIPLSDWRDLLASGHRVGPNDAALTIVEFGDFECPACAGFARTVAQFRKAYPRDFAVIFHHYPLDYHESAVPLARASECAAKQGRFEAFHDTVYSRQREMLKLSPLDIAKKVGVGDTIAYQECLSDKTIAQAVDTDLARALKLGASGTPTVIADGKMFIQLVDSTTLEGLLATSRR